jgi:TIR domain
MLLSQNFEQPTVIVAPRRYPIIISEMARFSRPSAAPTALTSPTGVKKQGFISYAHEDQDQFRAFQPYVKAVQRGLPWVEVKADDRIRSGQFWEDEILEMIASSHMFILLVSPAFLASDFIWQTELPAMRKRWQAVGGLLLPLVLKQCLWRVVCGAVQALPIESGKLKPIAEWDNPSRGFDHAHVAIASAIERHFNLPVQSFDWKAR